MLRAQAEACVLYLYRMRRTKTLAEASLAKDLEAWKKLKRVVAFANRDVAAARQLRSGWGAASNSEPNPSGDQPAVAASSSQGGLALLRLLTSTSTSATDQDKVDDEVDNSNRDDGDDSMSMTQLTQETQLQRTQQRQ